MLIMANVNTAAELIAKPTDHALANAQAPTKEPQPPTIVSPMILNSNGPNATSTTVVVNARTSLPSNVARVSSQNGTK